MDTIKVTHRFIILIPHRDAVKIFNEYRQELFRGGVNGALAFPSAAPLAQVSRPFSREELKKTAQKLKELASNTGDAAAAGSAAAKNTVTKNRGIIPSGAECTLVNSRQICFYGPALKLPIDKTLFPESTWSRIIQLFSPPVLCAAIIDPKEKRQGDLCPVLSFRAAALANLVIRPLINYDPAREIKPGEKQDIYRDLSYEWKISPLVWLPKN